MKGKTIILIIILVTLIAIVLTWFALQDIIEDENLDLRSFDAEIEERIVQI